MTYVRVINDSVEILNEFSIIRDKDNIQHPFNIVTHWDSDELKIRLNIYNIDDPVCPDDCIMTSEPELVIGKNGIPKWQYTLEKIPEPVEEPLPVVEEAKEHVWIEPVIEPPAPPAEPSEEPEPVILEVEAPPAPPAPEPTTHPDELLEAIERHKKKLQEIKLETHFENGEKVTPEDLENIKKLGATQAHISELRAYGGVVFRTLTLKKKYDRHQGHRHHFDHMTNLISGEVLCEVDGCEPTKFKAPAMITVAADKWHSFTALRNNTVYQCIFKQVDKNGKEWRDDIFTNENSPYGNAPYTKEELDEKLKLLDNPCAGCDNCNCDNEEQ